MATYPVQNFENHTNFPTTFVVASLVIFFGVVMNIVGLVMVTSTAGVCLIGTGSAVIGVGLIYALVVVRGYSTKLQDRIIRTEMRLRLAKVLPADMQDVIPNLTVKQLIALRFASDAEMADLVRKVVAEKIETSRPIKKMVKDWQGDYFRV